LVFYATLTIAKPPLGGAKTEPCAGNYFIYEDLGKEPTILSDGTVTAICFRPRGGKDLVAWDVIANKILHSSPCGDHASTTWHASGRMPRVREASVEPAKIFGSEVYLGPEGRCDPNFTSPYEVDEQTSKKELFVLEALPQPQTFRVLDCEWAGGAEQSVKQEITPTIINIANVSSDFALIQIGADTIIGLRRLPSSRPVSFDNNVYLLPGPLVNAKLNADVTLQQRYDSVLRILQTTSCHALPIYPKLTQER